MGISWITPNRNGLGPMPVDLALTYKEDQNPHGTSFKSHRTVGGGGSIAGSYEFSPAFRILANTFEQPPQDCCFLCGYLAIFIDDTQRLHSSLRGVRQLRQLRIQVS